MSAPLVLLPGMNCSARLWSQLDLEPAITPVLSAPTLAAQIDRLLDELPPTFALAGLSLGAIVAMALIRTAPERVERLALLSTNPYAPTSAQLDGWSGQRDRLAAGETARDLQRDILPLLVSPQSPPERVAQTLAMADDVGTVALDAQLQLQSTRIDERPGLARISVPTVVVAARQDALCPVARHEEIVALVPGAQLIVLEDTAHLSPLERPRELTAALRGWLSEDPARYN